MEVVARTVQAYMSNDYIEETIYMTYKECLKQNLDYTNYIDPDLGTKIYERLKNNSDQNITDISDNMILEQYKKKNHERIKKMLCEKIMNEEIPITYDINDWDCYEVDKKELKDKLYII